MKNKNLSRRDFLQLTALSVGALRIGVKAATRSGPPTAISLVTDPADFAVSVPSVRWAIEELAHALEQSGVEVRHFETLEQCPPSEFCVLIGGYNTPPASRILETERVSVMNAPQCLALMPSIYKGRPLLLACGSDARGLMYALLELTDQVRHSDDLARTLKGRARTVERPFNRVRSVGRLFVSDVEDKPWFNDREMWPAYFSMLATQRFNRFHLALGIGYDSLQNVRDAYFLFAYPFLVVVPGYEVKTVNLPDAERDQNLETLKFISRQAVAHGIDFQLGIWTHGHEWSQQANYWIEGLTPANHAAYCRDALAVLLKACPDISGVTLRTHAESGVREGSYSFWKTVFEGVPRSGRTKIEIDLHTKGLDKTIIDAALATGMPVKLSPKYWAEHMGLPYHQAAIRELEMPKENLKPDDFSSLSTGSRIFTRYGYADFLQRDRPYSVMYRIWPGTHRFLLWGDPVSTAAHARAFRFGGGYGAELFEPLSFKGRRGSGLPGGRCAYADTSLNPRWDWEKYLYTYRLWGRLLYDPDAKPEIWRRYLHKQFQSGAQAVEDALANGTRILPLVTTAHLPSAANDTFGPEFYTNQAIVDQSRPSPYGDTPSPKVFGNVSPLDPQLFSRINDFTGEMLEEKRTGKYSPIEVAQWLEDLAQNAESRLAEAEGIISRLENSAIKTSPDFRRMAADLKIQIGLGRFFASKLRCGTLYAVHEQSGDRVALEQALKYYRQARDIWSQFAELTDGIYVSDITMGPLPHMRGHWRDRLPAVDADIADMAQRLDTLPPSPDPPRRVHFAMQEALGRPSRSSVACFHFPPSRFIPGKALEIALSVKRPAGAPSVGLYYRHVNQSERYQVVRMRPLRGKYRAVIPGSYTASNYLVEYYFELKQGPSKAWLYPGLNRDLMNRPYFVVPVQF